MQSITNKKNLILSIIKLIILLLVIIGIPLYLYLKYGDIIKSFNDIDSFTQYIQTFGKESFIILFIMQIIQTVVAVIPGQAFELASGFLFGSIKGFILTMLGITTGSIISYYLAKLLGKDSLKIFIKEEKLNKYYEIVHKKKSLFVLFILYLIPGFLKDLINYVSGISGIRFVPYILLSTIGRIPGFLGGVLIGSSIEGKSYITALIIIIIFIIILALTYFFKDRITKLIEKKNE